MQRRTFLWASLAAFALPVLGSLPNGGDAWRPEKSICYTEKGSAYWTHPVTSWRTSTWQCTSTETKTSTVYTTPVTTTKITHTSTVTTIAPTTYSTATVTDRDTVSTTSVSVVSTTITTTENSSTVTVSSTSTATTPSGFLPVQSTLPNSTYSGSEGGSPARKRSLSRRNLDHIFGAAPWPGQGGRYPHYVWCYQWGYGKCSTATKTITKTSAGKTSTITKTSVLTSTYTSYPSATTTITIDVTSTTTLTSISTSTDTTTVTPTSTSITNLYAACATNNFADEINKSPIVEVIYNDPHKNQINATTLPVTGQDQAYQCCEAAILYPSAPLLWVVSNSTCFILYKEKGACLPNQGGPNYAVVTYNSSRSAEVGVIGNTQCGKFIHEQATS